MGHLFSRAFRRLTQCSSQLVRNSSSGPQQESASDSAAQQRDYQEAPTLVQCIPVGQSIDSAEFAAFETNRSGEHRQVQSSERPVVDENKNQDELDFENATDKDPQSPEVEEAVIKIQALVRGHLTRKALKDANQVNATPLPNALGQRQFDEESLVRNPPNAVFLPTSPLNLNANNIANDEQQQALTSKQQTTRKHLDSIAEDSESQNPAQDEGQHICDTQPTDKSLDLNLSEKSRGSLLPAPSDSRGSVSPVPSEANASIDIICDTPTSASIDILDHNIVPTDRISSVLHPKTSPAPSSKTNGAGETTSSITTTDNHNRISSTRIESPPSSPPLEPLVNSVDSSPDSAEAAAIKIQSAFRGYHTRKHSPYRRRSPNDSSLTQVVSINGDSPSAVRNSLKQQNATDIGDEDDESQVAERLSQAQDVGRRVSRQPQRDATQAKGEEVNNQAEEEIALRSTNCDEDSQLAAAVEDKSSLLDITGDSRTLARDTNAPDSSQLHDNHALKNSSKTDTLEHINSSIDTQSDANTTHGIGEILQQQEPLAHLESSNREQSIEEEWSNHGTGPSFNEDSTEQSQIAASSLGALVKDPSLDESLSSSSIIKELDSQSKRLERNLTAEDDEAALEEATDLLESALEQATGDYANGRATSEEGSSEFPALISTLNEEEQRAIELESDDIERRDPKGQASEQRAKSPQLSTELSVEGRPVVGTPAEIKVDNLTIEPLGELLDGSCSTPAPNSSKGGSSSDGETSEKGDDENGTEENGRQQESQEHKQDQTKNKKRNRNKKKGKK